MKFLQAAKQAFFDEMKSYKKRWKGVLMFLIIACGISAATGVKMESIVEIILLSFLAIGVIIVAIMFIYREKKQ